VLMKLYPEYKYSRLIPVSSEAGPGATTITYRMYDRAGSFGLISNYASDLPRTSVKASEHRVAVKPFGGSYGYNLDEIRAAKFANVALELLEAEACRQNYEQEMNKIAFLARPNDPTYGGLCGLVYQPNCIITRPATGTWSTATAKAIYQDMIDMVKTQLVLTNGIEQSDTMLLPLAEYTIVTTTPMTLDVGGSSGTVSGMETIASYFLKTNPCIRQLEWVNEL
jgi:hypothetical protein